MAEAFVQRCYLVEGSSSLGVEAAIADGKGRTFAVAERREGQVAVKLLAQGSGEKDLGSVSLETSMPSSAALFSQTEGGDGLFVVVAEGSLSSDAITAIVQERCEKGGPGDVPAGSRLQITGGTFVPDTSKQGMNSIPPDEAWGACYWATGTKLRASGAWTEWKVARDATQNLTASRGATSVVVTPSWSTASGTDVAILNLDGLANAFGLTVRIENSTRRVDETMFIQSSMPSSHKVIAFARQQLSLALNGSNEPYVSSAALADP